MPSGQSMIMQHDHMNHPRLCQVELLGSGQAFHGVTQPTFRWVLHGARAGDTFGGMALFGESLRFLFETITRGDGPSAFALSCLPLAEVRARSNALTGDFHGPLLAL